MIEQQILQIIELGDLPSINAGLSQRNLLFFGGFIFLGRFNPVGSALAISSNLISLVNTASEGSTLTTSFPSSCFFTYKDMINNKIFLLFFWEASSRKPSQSQSFTDTSTDK